ncbi:MAG TPA: YceI family protein [Acidimicrobiales bacterium]|nr:YceI family protein [Acidimicrobiales bacterium]
MTATSVGTVTLPTPGTYVVDPAHAEIGFVARHLIGTKVRGRFTEFSGSFTVAENPEESTLEAEANAGSIHTNQSMRDDHLRTNDFLDVEHHPKITLRSTGLKRITDSQWTLFTDLTVRGVTKPVEFDLEYLGQGPAMQEGKHVVAFSATAEIDRRDFGVSFNHALLDGSVVVGNKVKIELEVEAGLAD